MTIDEYVSAVNSHLPPWLAERRARVADLRSHLADRLELAASEAALTAELEPPNEYAVALMSELRFEPAPHGRRLAAFLIDIALGVPLALLVVLAWHAVMTMFVAGWPADMPRIWWSGVGPLIGGSALFLLIALVGVLALSAFVLAVIYFPVAEAVWGTTIGKQLMRLGVVAENGTRVTWLKAIIRRLPFYVEIFLLDAIFALFTERRQRAFDLVARTLVVEQR